MKFLDYVSWLLHYHVSWESVMRRFLTVMVLLHSSQTCGSVQVPVVYATTGSTHFIFQSFVSCPGNRLPSLLTISSSGPASEIYPKMMGIYFKVTMDGKTVWKKFDPEAIYLYSTPNAIWMIGFNYNSNQGYISNPHGDSGSIPLTGREYPDENLEYWIEDTTLHLRDC